MSKQIIFYYEGKPVKIKENVKIPTDPYQLIFDSYLCEEYVTDLEGLMGKLKTKGVAIVKNILDNDECEKMYNGAWDYLEHITGDWETPISRNDKTSWRQFSDLWVLHSMLLQSQGGIGHSQWLWDIRQNPKVIEVFQKIWNCENPEDLLVSFDGASIHLPPETTKKGLKGKSWLHTDQSYTRNEFECIQSWVTAKNVREGDATLMFLEGSHNHHKTIQKKFGIVEKENWFKLDEEKVKAYTDLGCKLRRIKCPAGSMVLWDSRTIHCGQECVKGRKEPNTRCVAYVCMQPRSLATEAMLKKKRLAFENMRTTAHWPANVKLFAKTPWTHGAVLRELKPVEKPIVTKLGMKLSGF